MNEADLSEIFRVVLHAMNMADNLMATRYLAVCLVLNYNPIVASHSPFFSPFPHITDVKVSCLVQSYQMVEVSA